MQRLLPVSWDSTIALDAIESLSMKLGAAFVRNHPRTACPGWIVTNMLIVSAIEFGNPVLFFVLMEADDFSIH